MNKNTEEVKEKIEDTVDTADEQHTDAQNSEKESFFGISVVIPYLKSEANGQELRLALRSWQEHFKDEFHIVIIGDKEDWFDEDNIVYIPVERKSLNPQVNLIEAVKIAVADERVTPYFIWSNDDIYLLNDITVEYIAVPKALGAMHPENYNGHYKKNMENTLYMLSLKGLNINYGTHTPFFFSKEKIEKTFKRYPEALKGECLFESLYYAGKYPIIIDLTPNRWQYNSWLLPVISMDPNLKALEEFSTNKLFMNNTPKSYSQTLEKFLYDRYPRPSRFEIESR